MAREIEHITVTTGASRMSLRSEVSDAVVDWFRATLADGGSVGLGWTVQLLPTPSGGYVYDLKFDRVSVARCWLCDDLEISAQMWDAASSGRGHGVILRLPERTPWLAVALTVDPAKIVENFAIMMAISEVGDIERCVAWALLE